MPDQTTQILTEPFTEEELDDLYKHDENDPWWNW